MGRPRTLGNAHQTAQNLETRCFAVCMLLRSLFVAWSRQNAQETRRPMPNERDVPLEANQRGRTLESWKEIAAYLGRDVTTVQRWERQEGLPVRRLQHSRRGSVYAYTTELDAWRSSRERSRPGGEALSHTQPGPTAAESPAFRVAPIVMVVLVVVATVGAFIMWRGRGASSSTPPANLVVVAIFEGRTPGASADAFGRQAADYIIRTLGQVSTVAVMPAPIPVSELGNSQTDEPPALGRVHGATLLITGDYYLHDDQFVIQSRILNAATGRLLYASAPVIAPGAAPAESLPRLGERIAGAVATHFDEFFGGLEVVSQPPPLEAYREYRAGLELFAKDVPRSVSHLNRALDLEPSFWVPKAILFYAYSNLRDTEQARLAIEDLVARRDLLNPPERLFIDFRESLWEGRHAEASRALSEVEKANARSWGVNFMLMYLAMAMNRPRDVVDLYYRPAFDQVPLPDHRVALWRITLLSDALHRLGEHRRELEQSRIAQRLAPDDAATLSAETAALAALGRTDEVSRTIDRDLARIPDGQATLMNSAASELRAHGQPEAARALAARSVKWLRSRSPEVARSIAHRADLGESLFQAGELDEAAEVFRGLRDERPDQIAYWGYLGVIAAMKGETDGALGVSERLAHLTGHLSGEHTFWRARIAALLGRHREAIDLLREASAQGAFESAYVHIVPDFDALRDDETFQQLTRPQD